MVGRSSGAFLPPVPRLSITTYLPVLARSVVEDPRLFGLAWPVFGLTAALSTLLAGAWLRRATRLRIWAVAHTLMGIGVLLPSLWLSGLTVGLSALLAMWTMTLRRVVIMFAVG